MHAGVPDQRVKRHERRAIACHAQAPAGIPVEPMNEFEGLARARRAKRLDDTEAHAATAVYRDARRLVDHQEVFVLENHRLLDELLKTR